MGIGFNIVIRDRCLIFFPFLTTMFSSITDYSIFCVYRDMKVFFIK